MCEQDINGIELVTVAGKREYNVPGENPADKRSVRVRTIVVGVYNVNAGNVEDPPMAVVLLIRLHRQRTRWVYIDSVSVTSQVASSGHSVLPGRTAKLPTSTLSSCALNVLKRYQTWNGARGPSCAVESDSKSACAEIKYSASPQGQDMHLRHVTCIIQKPSASQKTLTCYQ